MNHAVILKNFEKCEKTYRYQAYSNNREGRKNHLVSGPNNPMAKVFSENFLATE